MTSKRWLTARTRPLLLGGALALTGAVNAQVLVNEQFTGGASTTGFTIAHGAGDCEWLYAPGGLVANNFNRDGDGALPNGGGFDGDFVFIDADECASSGETVETTLTSAPFDASAPGSYVLSFSEQLRADFATTTASVEVYNGTTWTEVLSRTGTGDDPAYAGFPNPAIITVLDITAAAGGSPMAQVRFNYDAGWAWWWALDAITIERTDCSFPDGVAVADITTDGASVSWTDNGAAGYEWVITEGPAPDGSNAVASGTGANTTATGLSPATAYAAFVRALCTGGGNSAWSSGTPFVTGIVNDACAAAVVLTVNSTDECTATTHGTVTGATDSGVTTDCFGAPDDDVWFSFVATNTAHYVQLLNVTGSNTDLYHAVWSGACADLTLVEGSCSDGDFSLASGLNVGQTYFVQVYTYTDEPGQDTQFDVCISTPPPAPANDECAGAVPVTVNADLACGTVTAGSTTSATGSGLESECFGTADDDVWFSFVATRTAHYISLLNVTGSNTDMYHAVWSGDCADLTLVDGSCEDGDQGVVSGLTVGNTYYIQVYTYTSEPGQATNFDVCVGTLPPPPANDECSGAVAVTVNADLECANVTPGTVQSATGSGLDSECFGTADDDVWFSFVATNPTHYIELLNVEGSTTDLYHAVWSGDCSDLTLMNGSCSDGDLSAVSGLTVGNTYYVQVYTYTDVAGQTTTFDVCVGTPPPPPANDECSAATAVTVNLDNECTNVTPGTVQSATGSGLDSDCFGTADDDVWFSFVATNTSHFIELLNAEGSNTDLYHAVWGGDCSDLTLLNGSCSDGDLSSVGGLTVGNTYYIQVYTYTNTPGQTTTFDVCVRTPGPGPANDECAGAVALTVNNDLECDVTTAGTIENATNSGMQSEDCFGTADDDVWYSFVATQTEHVIGLNDVTGSTTDLYMALWTGDCGDLTLVDGSCSDPEELTIDGLTVGTTYYLQVYSYTNTPGQDSEFDVCVGIDPSNFPPDCLGVPGGPAQPGTPCINTQFNVGGIWTANCLCQPNVGVDEVSSVPFHVSPNPASTELFLSLEGSNAVNVRVYDVVGHLVMERALAKRLAIDQLGAGTYTLLAVDAQGKPVARTRFVKR